MLGIGFIVLRVAFYDIRENIRYQQMLHQATSSSCCNRTLPAKPTLRSAVRHAMTLNHQTAEGGRIDACVVSRAFGAGEEVVLETHPKKLSAISWASSGKQTVPHITRALCQRPEETHHVNEERLQTVMAFKTHKSVSMLLENVLTKALVAVDRPFHAFPDVFNECGDTPSDDATKQAQALGALFRQSCEKYGDQCFPARNCTEPAEDAVFIASMNPRNLNPQLPWDRVVPKGARVFDLRRTNLILHAYRQWRRDLCGVGKHSWKSPRVHNGQKMQVADLLRCVKHYSILEQEYTSSVARQVAAPQRPLLLVYEDTLSHGHLAQRGILEYLGPEFANLINDTDQDGAATAPGEQLPVGDSEYAGSEPFCQFPGVVCDILKKSYLQDHYPCLYKQLRRVHENRAWSVPLLPNGTISVHGDCHVLEPLSKDNYVRQYNDLYQFTVWTE